MKNLNRYTEPDNYIDQSGRLIKFKWFALIAAVGIALLFFLSGCSDGKSNQYKKPFIIIGKVQDNWYGQCNTFYTYIEANGNKHTFREHCNKYNIGDTIK